MLVNTYSQIKHQDASHTNIFVFVADMLSNTIYGNMKI